MWVVIERSEYKDSKGKVVKRHQIHVDSNNTPFASRQDADKRAKRYTQHEGVVACEVYELKGLYKFTPQPPVCTAI